MAIMHVAVIGVTYCLVLQVSDALRDMADAVPSKFPNLRRMVMEMSGNIRLMDSDDAVCTL